MTDLVPVTRVIVERRETIERYLQGRMTAGRLLTPIDQVKATPTRKDPGLYWLRVTVLEPAPKTGAREWLAGLDKRHPIGGPIAKALAFGLAVLAGLLAMVLALIELIMHTVSLRSLETFGGALLLLLAIALLASRRKAGGRHSSHDGKGWHYTDCK